MQNHSRWVRGGSRLALGLGLLLSGLTLDAAAQGFRGSDGGRGFGGSPPSPEDMFRRMDRNQNGQIDPDEFGFMRDFYSRSGIDVSRPMSLQDFTQASTKIREQFEQARSSGDFSQFRRPDSGGGPPSFGSGPPPSFGGGPPSFGGGPPSFGGGPPSFGGGPPSGSGSSGSDRDSRRDDRDRDRRSESSPSSKSKAKPKVRITKDLPTDYRTKDKNGDGQIGLYEWDRSAFAQFQELDRNGDGLLTADELLAAAKKAAIPAKTLSSSSAQTFAPTSSSRGSSSPSTSPSGEVVVAKPAVPPVGLTPASKAFLGLDTDNDGTLTEEEWKRSRSARSKFEKAGIAISFPIQQAQFVELYKKVEAQ